MIPVTLDKQPCVLSVEKAGLFNVPLFNITFPTDPSRHYSS